MGPAGAIEGAAFRAGVAPRPDVSVVALDGRAGTGKTLLAIAAGLEQVVEQRAYEKLAVYRPLVPVGRADVGFLPGGLDEKLDPWMSAIHDAIVALTDQRSATTRTGWSTSSSGATSSRSSR
jgi:predicted ribonuclease YlaK